MFGPDCHRTRGEFVCSYDEPPYEHMTALNARIAALGARRSCRVSAATK